MKETLKIVNKKAKIVCAENLVMTLIMTCLKTEYNDYVREFVDIMYCNYFQHCILEPTSILKNLRASLIDNIFTNVSVGDRNIHSRNFLDIITEQLSNFVIIEKLYG